MLNYPIGIAMEDSSGQITAVVNPKLPIPRLWTPPVTSQRQRTSRACVACHQRKTKCDGRKPQCKQCRQLGFSCSYVGSKRERERSELQSVKAKIKSYEDLLQKIVTESSDDPYKIKLIEDLISKHFVVTPDVLRALLAPSSPSDRSVSPPKLGISLERMHVTWSARPRSALQPLCKQPLVRLTAIHHWTSLVDNDTASHLLSLYFAWENPTWQLIDQYSFLRDLERGHGRFCSSLLVTALLFFGCSLSYHFQKITDRREEKILSKKLYDEIQRLWELQKGDVTLPTAQSSIMIGLLCCTFGLDRIGTQYIMHGAKLCLQFNLPGESSYFGDDVDGQNLRCHKLVAWAIYDVQGLASQVYRKVPAWKQPPSVQFSLQEAAALDEEGAWSPYPFASPVWQPFFYTAACARSNLVVIVHKIAQFALKFPDGDFSSDDWRYGYRLYEMLLDWKATLPSQLQLEHNTTPHVICLHQYYHATIASICQVFIANADLSSDDHPDLEGFDPLAIISQALDTMGSLILLFKRYHGWKSLPVVMLHYFCVAGVHSISKLSAQEPKWGDVLEDCVVGLWHMSLGWGRLCTAFLRTIELVLQQSKSDKSLVPPKVLDIFRHLHAGDLWTATDISSLAADYVVHHVPNQDSGSSFKSQGLQSLITSMDSLSVREQAES
ncbi:Zn(II)2Cys6 transcription factor [Aspergillus avenaceus]|uniref:Zn(II)2Cys6 transcription factor n=1 Tax=Aspergillus avenaceus TaxID=36643 RepID=A0A5N6U8J5_ASPAV|nr:Zn(II)2Cys6 transcription factor [Aspergillus avenaceus]